jgi:hypothetical protein
MDDDERQVFNYLLDALPLHSEEDSIREDILETVIIKELQTRIGSVSLDIRTIVFVVRKILLSLELLDEGKIREKKWALVSFPASLVARSMLETLSSEKPKFFRSGYWSQGGRPVDEVEKQREFIRALEIERTKEGGISRNPIRTVHVAWGIIRLSSTFLLFKREDKDRPEVKGYSFTGGRLSIKDDLPVEERNSSSLRELFRIDTELAKKNLETTLVREMEEETLLQRKDYSIKDTFFLSPYCKVEGPRNHHAYTQYNISVNSIKLTKEGELKLLERVSNKPELFRWFTSKELISGSKPDGSSAFVEALLADSKIEDVAHFLDSFEDSSSSPPIFQKDEESLELPPANTIFLQKGKAGKQKDIQVKVSEDEWELLMLLGWHARGLAIRNLDPQIVLLGGGWVKLCENELKNLASSFAQKLNEKLPMLIDFHRMGFCRLSILPERLFLQPGCFSYKWDCEGNGKPIIIELHPITTKYGWLEGKVEEIPVTPTLKNAMSVLDGERIKRPNEELFENEETVIRQFNEAIKKVKIEIGLRQFIKTNQYSIAGIVVPKE